MKTGYELWKGVWYATQCNVDSDADENPERVYIENALAVRAPILKEALEQIRSEVGECSCHEYNEDIQIICEPCRILTIANEVLGK